MTFLCLGFGASSIPTNIQIVEIALITVLKVLSCCARFVRLTTRKTVTGPSDSALHEWLSCSLWLSILKASSQW